MYHTAYEIDPVSGMPMREDNRVLTLLVDSAQLKVATDWSADARFSMAAPITVRGTAVEPGTPGRCSRPRSLACWLTSGTIPGTPPVTSCSRGDIVLVRFVLADEKGAKQRPGLIVSTNRYHQGRREAILVAITSNVGRLLHVVEGKLRENLAL